MWPTQAPSRTASPAVAASGLPTFTAALPGTLNRIFALIAKMKLSSAMTEAIDTDLGSSMAGF